MGHKKHEWCSVNRNQPNLKSAPGQTDRRGFLHKTLFQGLGLLGGAAALPACSDNLREPSSASQGRLRIIMIGTVLSNPFWDMIQKGAAAAGGDLSGVDLTYSAPEEFSLANLNELIKSAVSAKPDGIAIDYRGKAFEKVTGHALDQGLAVQFYNNYKGLGSSDPRIVRLSQTAVGLDKLQVARRSARAFMRYVEVGDELVLFNGLPDSPEHLEIQNAYLKVFRETGWAESELMLFPVGLDPAQNFQLMKTYLASHPGTRGIVCWDSPTGSAAARAKRDAGLKIPVMAWNLDPVVIRSIRTGAMNLTLTQQPYLQGFYAVVALYVKLKYGFTEPPFVDPGSLIVDRSNVSQVEQLFRKGIAG